MTEKKISARDELSTLIEGCIAHSRSAQKKLYDTYSPEAYGVIRRVMYNNEPVAKEILNDVFFKVFKDISKYSFQGAFEGWIRKIVLNTIADYLRRPAKHDMSFKEIQPEDAYIDSGPIEHMSHKELLRIVSTLPDAQREVFNLFVFENYSHKEIGKMLNINDSNCRWHLNDARRRLKEKINSIIK